MSCRALLRVCSLFLLLLCLLLRLRSGETRSPLEEYRSSIQEALSRVESEKGPLKSEECAFFDEHFPPHLDVKPRAGKPVQVDNGSAPSLGERKPRKPIRDAKP